MTFKPLSNFDIETICQSMKIPLKGVFSKDELYTIPHENGMYVVNMQNSNAGNGTHWVCCVKRTNLSIYFDSFGFTAPIAVIDFLKPSVIAYSNNDIQFMASSACGWFCIAFLKFIQRYINGNHEPLLNKYNQFITMFSEDEVKNDAILTKLLEKQNQRIGKS